MSQTRCDFEEELVWQSQERDFLIEIFRVRRNGLVGCFCASIRCQKLNERIAVYRLRILRFHLSRAVIGGVEMDGGVLARAIYWHRMLDKLYLHLASALLNQGRTVG